METQDTLNTLTSHWSKAIDLSEKDRKERFWDVACDIKRFYDSDHRFLYEAAYKNRFMSTGGDTPEPKFKVSVNKVAEYVALHLPVLYHRNPTRTVTPRKPALSPELQTALGINPLVADERFATDQARAGILEYLLNVWPVEMDLKREARQALTEGLVPGRGVLWCEIEQGPLGKRPGLFYEPVENLLVDADAEQLRQAGWIGRKRRRRTCDVEYERGMPPGTLKGTSESVNKQAQVASEGSDGVLKRKEGKTTDVIEYTEIYSRIGLGAKLAGVPQDLREILDSYGDEVYLEICPDLDYPLNLTREFMESLKNPLLPEDERARMIHDAVGWPTRFWKDPTWPWPFAELDFCYVSKSCWPMAPLAPAMAYQVFLDWAYSFLAGRLPIECRTFFACPKGLEKNIEEVVLNGCDMSLVHYDSNKMPNQGFKDLVGFIQQPPINQDIFTVTAAIEKKFEEATGMTQLAYGNPGDTQSRSATDIQVRQQNLSVRPDDMANKVEDWMTKAAKLQVICAREHLGPEDVAAYFGEQYVASEDPATPASMGEMTALWVQLCAAKDIDQIIGDFEYRIESGSARKPNKGMQVERSAQTVQTLLPILLPLYQQTQDPTQVNAILRDYLEANDWENVDEVLFPTAEEMMQRQAELQLKQMEIQAQMQGRMQQMGMVQPQTIPMQQGASA